jgi:hypothetical protein
MSYKEKMQKLADEFFAENGGKLASARDMAKWAMKNGKWSPPLALAEERCASDFADAMREQYITAPDGRRIRTKHAARKKIDGRQQTLWGDLFDNPPRDFMETALQQRRQQVYGDCKQLRNDTDYYNEEHIKQEPIQLVLDFEEELAEEKALREMENSKKKAA